MSRQRQSRVENIRRDDHAQRMCAESHIKGLPLLRETIAPKDLEIRWVMSLWSLRRGVGLVGSHLLVSRRCSGRQRGVVLKPVTRRVPRRSMKTARVARFRARLPDAKRPSRWSPCQKSAIRTVFILGGGLLPRPSGPRPPHQTRGLQELVFRGWGYHLAKNNYSFDALQAYCFGINLKL